MMHRAGSLVPTWPGWKNSSPSASTSSPSTFNMTPEKKPSRLTERAWFRRSHVRRSSYFGRAVGLTTGCAAAARVEGMKKKITVVGLLLGVVGISVLWAAGQEFPIYPPPGIIILGAG